MLEQMKDVLSLISELAPIALTFIGVFVGWKHTGKIDLVKTLEATEDAVGILRIRLTRGDKMDEELATSTAVELVREIRGHTVNKKMSRKIRARVKARLGALLNLNKDAE